MGLYNFKERFWPFILDGRKQHTIRKDRADGRVDTAHIDTCHCFGGLRTKNPKLLGRWPCIKVERIVVHGLRPPEVFVNEQLLTIDEAQQLARRDGFKDWDEMANFWEAEHDLPFYGHIIHWKFSNQVEKQED